MTSKPSTVLEYEARIKELEGLLAVEQQNAEVATERLADLIEDRQRVIERPCPPDERHCPCVTGAFIRAEKAEALLASITTLHPSEDYHEDYGNVLWWSAPIKEPPYCGTSLDDGFIEEYYTHWSRLPDCKDPDEVKP